MKQENGVGPNYDWAGIVAPEPKPEGLNPSIHCSLYDDQAVYWVPDASKGLLTREVFTDIDAVTSTVRVDADCHEGEIEYAVSTIRAHQIKPSASPSTA